MNPFRNYEGPLTSLVEIILRNYETNYYWKMKRAFTNYFKILTPEIL